MLIRRFGRFLLFAGLLMGFSSQAQNGRPAPAGARGIGMGQVSLAFNDIYTAFGHQAGLANLESFSAAAFGERRFELSELGNYSAALAYPTNSGVLALNFSTFGFDAYQEQRVGLAYARKLMEQLNIGLQINYLNTRISEYGSNNLFTFELSFQSQLSRSFSISGHLYSPIRVEVTPDEDLPTIFKIGFAYRPSDKLLLAGEVLKQIDLAASARAGLEYSIYEAFFLRLGIRTQPTQPSFGFGYAWGNGLKVDIASSYHAMLGFSPAFGMAFELN
ncbi:MAG: hypothetical protein AAGG75_20935 [Bacteroidota bacterium]